MFKMTAFALTVCLMSVPAFAQDTDETLQEGMDLLQQGTQLLLQGLMDEIGPALQELGDRVIDLNAYQAPEILPNGDIIIRRKIPLDPDPLEDGEIEL